MKAGRFFLACLVLVCTVAASARAAEPPAGDPLAALSWLAGGTWVSEIQASDGRPLRVESKFDWAEHGRALKYVIHFRTAERTIPQYEGVYFWHPGKKQIHMLQIDRSGNITESVATVDGDTIKQENQATAADGTTRPQRVSVARKGDDAFEFKALVQRDGEWADAVGFTYKRKGAAKGAASGADKP